MYELSSRAGSRRRWRTVISPSGSESSWPVDSRTCRSISLYHLLGLVLPAVDEQPARALGQVAAHQQNPEAERRASSPKHSQPSEVDRKDVGVKRQDRQQSATSGACPVAPIDSDVRATARLGGDQLRRWPS